jgi:lipid II:glycine glycyltransferase (peptidoglycan interpeptide bridge formation enzyme)
MSVRIADLYFGEFMPSELHSDIVRCHQLSTPILGASCTPFCTIVIDLTRPESELFAKLKSHTRYKIRRAAERDGIVYEFSNDGNPEAVRRFADHFDLCASLKRLAAVSRQRLRILASQRVLDLSFVRDAAGEILAASSYLLTPTRVRGLYAGASYRATADHTRRALIGRANRLLYWQDMLRFKRAGVRLFDFGGYYAGTDDAEKLRINEFKLEFGGKILHEFNCAMGVTLKGKVILWAIQQREQWLSQRRIRPKEVATERSVADSV